jgi:photosystem II stability/assembly factor-like uncharacterized protein
MAADPSRPETVYVGTEPVHLYRSEDAGASWVELESLQRLPEAVRDKWWFPQYPHEGHVKSIYVDPRGPGRVYLALEHGGLLRTDDRGETWEEISDGIEYLDIHLVDGDPARENVVFAATARGFYRSEDYGRDWILAQDGLSRDNLQGFAVCSGTQGSLFLTATRGTPPTWIRPSGAESAVFRSTDSGVSWRRLGGGLPTDMARAMGNVLGDPLDPGRLYLSASGWEPRLSQEQNVVAGGEVWTSADRGERWARVYEAPTPVRLLAVAAG